MHCGHGHRRLDFVGVQAAWYPANLVSRRRCRAEALMFEGMNAVFFAERARSGSSATRLRTAS